MNKLIITFIGLASFLAVSIGCGSDKKADSANDIVNEKTVETEVDGEKETTATASNTKGKLVFKQNCIICHGADGKLGINEATDLSTSTITMEERVIQITNGKGLMIPYKDILSEDQIEAVASYLDELKK